MADILWIESDGGAAAELPYRVVSADEALAVLDASEPVDVVAIGTSVVEPLHLAHQVRGRDELLEILIIARSERVDALREALTVHPFVGVHTRVVSAGAGVCKSVEEAAEAAGQRRLHRRTIEGVQATLEQSGPAVRRPSPQQYAATMWSASPVGALAVVRHSCHIVGANPAAARLLGQDEIELLGQSLHEVFPLGDHDGWAWLSEVVGEHDTEHVVDLEVASAEIIHLEVRAVEVDSSDDDIVVLFLWDISERVRFQELQSDYLAAERRAREQAERARRIREDVLATVSHDLRGPLQTLLASASVLEMLTENSPDSKTAEFVQTIARAGGYMKRLVEDLLDVTRIESGGLALELERASAAELVDEAVGLAAGAAAERGVTVEYEPVPDALALDCDATRVVQLLQNLLNNAIRFSEPGQVVRIAAGAHAESVRLTISDEGPGIPSEDIPHLFGRFWQSDRRDKRGAGLGLAIVRGIVDAHGGEISVDSAPGEGATFHIDLPRAQ